MGRRPKEGRPAGEQAALDAMTERAQLLLVVPTPHELADATGIKKTSARSIYRKLVELGDLAQTDGGVYYLPDEGEG